MAEELRIRVVFDTGQFKKGSNDLTKSSTAVAGSLAHLQQQVRKLEQTFMNATGAEQQAVAYREWQTAQNQLNAQMLKINQTMSGSTRTTASMTMALQSMNFTVRDAPYLFRDFSLGILAIGNNLNPLIDNLIRVKMEANAVGMTMRQSLIKALSGANGVIFLFSILVTVIQAVVFQLAKKKQETKDAGTSLDEYINKVKTATDRLVDFADKLKKLDARDLDFALRGLKKETEDLNMEMLDTFVLLSRFEFAMGELGQVAFALANAFGLVGTTWDEFEEKLEANLDRISEAEKAFNSFQSALQKYRGGIDLRIDVAPEERDRIMRFVEKELEKVPEEQELVKLTIDERQFVYTRKELALFVQSLKDLRKASSEAGEPLSGIVNILEAQIKKLKERLGLAESQVEIDTILLEIKNKEIQLEEILRKHTLEKYILTDNVLKAQINRLENLKKEELSYREIRLLNYEINKLKEEGRKYDLEEQFGGRHIATSYSGQRSQEEFFVSARLEVKQEDLIRAEKKLKDFQEKIESSSVTETELYVNYQEYERAQDEVEKLRKEVNELYNQEMQLFMLRKAMRQQIVEQRRTAQEEEQKSTLPVGKLKKVEKPEGVGEFTDEEERGLRRIEDASEIVGTSLYQAFIMGKMGADELLKSLVAIVAQLLIIEGMKWLISGGTIGIFGIRGYKHGGVAGYSSGGVTTFDSASNDDIIPANLAPQEMLLNRRQTLNLFNAIRSGDFSQISKERKVNIELSGEVYESKTGFHKRVKVAETHHNTIRGNRTIGR